MVISNLQVLVISLASHRERRNKMTQQLDKLNFIWNFVDGIDGSKLKAPLPNYDEKRRIKKFKYPLSNGEIGCFLSHRMAWMQCVELNQVCLILEDDCEINVDIENALSLVAQSEQQWDIFRLWGRREVPSVLVKKYGDYQIIEHLQDPEGSVAYLVKPSSAKVLISHSYLFSTPVDTFLGNVYAHKQRTQSITPYPITATTEHSMINDRNKPQLKTHEKLSRELYRIPDGLKKFLWRSKRQFLNKIR